MLDYDALGRVFTYGRVGMGWSGSSPALIFSTIDPEDWDDFKNPATARRLALSPPVQEVMGDRFFIRRGQDSENENAPMWIFSGEMSSVIRALDNLEDPDSVFVITPEQGFRRARGKETVDNCLLPQRFAMSCGECLRKATKSSPHDCWVKSLIMEEKEKRKYGHNIYELNIPLGPLNSIRSEWVHGYSQIEEFVYISPSMTADYAPQETMRKPNDHSFKYMKERAIERSLNQKERKRFEDFLAQECPRCTIHKECHYAHDARNWRHCDGPLLWKWDDIADEMLKGIKNPFNNQQLRYLLAHSGSLDRRYKQCIVGVTLHMEYPDEVTFRVRRKTKPYSRDDLETFRDFAEARKFLEVYKNEEDLPRVAPLTKMRKAILFEALAKRGSPRYSAGWGTISYPVHHIHSSGRGFRQYYSYKSGGRGLIGWNNDYFETLADVYKAFGYFSLFHATHYKSPLSRDELKRQLSRK